MTTVKARAFYMAARALLTALILYPMLRETRREQQWDYFMSPEDVKCACGKPQADDIWTLTYADADRRVELQFFGMNHRMFLQHVRWSSSRAGVGEISQVSRDVINEQVRTGGLPACLEQAAL